VPAERHALLRLMAEAVGTHGLATTYAAKLAHDRSQPAWVEPDAETAAFLARRFTANAPASLRAMTLHLVESADTTVGVRESGVPVLVAYGAEDDGWPPVVQEEMAVRLGARVMQLDGAGHSPAVDDPDGLAKVLTAFWEQLR
jgi:pimeloyl-ACP methyl ester carboxylesterase